MVNTQELQGYWNKIQGQIKEKWGTLTDDDLRVHNGNIDQVIGKIQQKTGESRDAIEKFINGLTDRGASKVSQVAEAAGQYAQQAGDQLRQRYADVAEHLGEGYQHVEHTVRRNPGQSVAAAFGVGLAFGLLFGLTLRSR